MRKNAGFLILLILIILSGCQAIFTFSPLSGLKRDPANMPPAQRLQYAKDALASGDKDAMLAAYNAILNDTGADAQYTAAQLGIELSGVTQVLLDCANDPSTITAQLSTIDAFITSHGLNPNYMVAAAYQLIAAQAAGAVLTTMDYAMIAMGIVLENAYLNSTTWNITAINVDATAQPIAYGYTQTALGMVASLPSGDPLKDFITQLDAFISGL
jgi:hypothetical protein